MTSSIVVEGLGKRYRMGEFVGGESFRELVMGVFKRPFRRAPREAEHLWALRDINFTVEQGEVLGVVGKNGAGKSTLLKVLTGITEPTTGRVELRGNVASLLEVGTGFHGELTGRENIFLNGSILGMSRAEIRRKFDEIVAFSGVEKFLDTPVKRYSSGMYMRLAFSVAAHLEQEILLIDEVLAVGDAEFQRKCLGKMGEVAQAGRTVLFVSHNMGAVRRLCPRSLLLADGQVVLDDSSERVIGQYMSANQAAAGVSLRDRTDRTGDGRARLVEVRIATPAGEQLDTVHSGQDISIELTCETEEDERFHLVLGILAEDGVLLSYLSTRYDPDHAGGIRLDQNPRVSCRIPSVPLPAGRYWLNLVVWNAAGSRSDWIQGAMPLDVQAGDFYRVGGDPTSGDGRVLMPHRWVPAKPGQR